MHEVDNKNRKEHEITRKKIVPVGDKSFKEKKSFI